VARGNKRRRPLRSELLDVMHSGIDVDLEDPDDEDAQIFTRELTEVKVNVSAGLSSEVEEDDLLDMGSPPPRGVFAGVVTVF
jgi:hypothetical protein